jgi:hypothetical protein
VSAETLKRLGDILARDLRRIASEYDQVSGWQVSGQPVQALT